MCLHARKLRKEGEIKIKHEKLAETDIEIWIVHIKETVTIVRKKHCVM